MFMYNPIRQNDKSLNVKILNDKDWGKYIIRLCRAGWALAEFHADPNRSYAEQILAERVELRQV